MEEKGLLYSFGKAMRSIIGFSIVLLSFAFLFMLMYKEIPTGNKEIINIATGLVLAALGGVVGYYFGASKDSSDTNKVVNAVQAQDAGINKQ